ncbi:hypothetical protein HETIRDRAFT_429694 [Heterobasidion irregulare TC 32-1]|uniref:Uncharacterized protein n=1 Tax=Heterobasidion irregulare (strain TC 32-1) TaxID=747525 RepID=W4JX77_HETIT|nr:uncharacterized protein HETIRDRAFT_429694 [Heterobasidion irregulare TC 32-1]ETW77486.1 hypothetical protein HETIRDRAFT_429694 [Heterobasidion irregulare TC 32-1]
MHKKDSQPHENIILLGMGLYDDAIMAIIKFIGNQTIAISTWEAALVRLPQLTNDKPKGITSKHKELMDLITIAMNKIKEVNWLYTKVTKYFTMTASYVIGFVLYCTKVKMDKDKIEWKEFKGNKLFIVMAKNDKFSDGGDSGLFVVDYGRWGPTNKMDKMYTTPFYMLQKAIKKKYLNCHLVLTAA